MAGRGKGRRKPAKKNSFMIFTEDFRAKQSALGIRYQNLSDAIAAASPHWKKLSPEEKAKYTKKAKEQNFEAAEKYTSEGISITQIINEQNAVKQQRELEETTINYTIEEGVKNNSFTEQSFCIIHTNFYCVTIDGFHSTCEVAVALFNLKKGVQYTYHTIVDTEIPLGYAYDAGVKSKEIGIDVPPVDNSEQDDLKIYTQLYGICRETQNDGGKKLPPFYAMPNDVEPANDFLDQICSRIGVDNEFKVFSLPLLFYKLRNQITVNVRDLGIPTLSLALNELTNDRFAYSSCISCDLHKNGEQYNQCSLSIVQRMAFIICDHCCGAIGITMTPGKHFPQDAKFMDGISVKIEEEQWSDNRRKEKCIDNKVVEPPIASRAWKVEVNTPSNVPIRKPFDHDFSEEDSESKTKKVDSSNPWNKIPGPSSTGSSGTSTTDNYASFPELSGRGRGVRSFANNSSSNKSGSRPGEPSVRPNLPGRGRGYQK